MLSAPPTMKQQIEQFTRYIRASDEMPDARFSTKSHYYREFIRSNIKDVVYYSFPLFCQHFDEETIAALIRDFLETHKTVEPEFHHIATEFVRFTQHHYAENTVIMALLEYEWLLFSIEIDPDRVICSKKNKTAAMIEQQDLTITLNPTLQFIKLPFPLEDIKKDACPIQRGDYYYVMFRNSRHQILQKSIGESDYTFINLITENNGCHFSTIKQACNIQASNNLITWLQYSLSTNLVI